MCDCFNLTTTTSQTTGSSSEGGPQNMRNNRLDVDEMECRIQALEKFRAKFEAADVFRRLDALEDIGAAEPSALNAHSIIRRIEKLENKVLTADPSKMEVERRLEALVELTADGSYELDVEQSILSDESDQFRYSMASDEGEDSQQSIGIQNNKVDAVLQEGFSTNRTSDTDAAALQQANNVMLQEQKAALINHEECMDKMLVRLDSAESAQQDNVDLTNKALDVMQEVKSTVDRLLDCYVMLSSDMVSLSLEVGQHRRQLKTGFKEVRKLVKSDMIEQHHATLSYVHRSCHLLYESGRVVSELYKAENEVKDTQTELKGIETTLTTIRPNDKSQKAAAARADLNSRKTELECYLNHLDRQQDSLKEKFIYYSKTADELRGIGKPTRSDTGMLSE